MSKTSIINIGFFVLGIIGFFFISDLFAERSVPWFSTMFISLFLVIIGVIMLQIKWGGKRKQELKKPGDDYDLPPEDNNIF